MLVKEVVWAHDWGPERVIVSKLAKLPEELKRAGEDEVADIDAGGGWTPVRVIEPVLLPLTVAVKLVVRGLVESAPLLEMVRVPLLVTVLAIR